MGTVAGTAARTGAGAGSTAVAGRSLTTLRGGAGGNSLGSGGAGTIFIHNIVLRNVCARAWRG